MNWDDPPSTLDAELLKVGWSYDAVAGGEGVGVQQGASNNGNDDDGETTTENGGAIANNSTASDGAQIGNDLGNGDSIGAEVVLVAQHGRIKILRAVGLVQM